MQVHFVAIEIGVVTVAVGVMHADGLFFGEHSGDMGHQRGLVECGLAIEQEHVATL
jgi:hypothetical protein